MKFFNPILERIDMLSTSLFLRFLVLLFVLNYTLIRFPYSLYLAGNNQGVEASRLQMINPLVRNLFADAIFFSSLILAFCIMYLIRKSIKFYSNMNSWILNPYLLVMILVIIPSFFSVAQPKFVSKYFLYVFSIGHLNPNFGDLRGVMSGISNVTKVGEQIPCFRGECVPTTWIYGRGLLLLPEFRATDAFIILISLIFTFLLIKLLLSVSAENGRTKIVLLLISPPIVLLFERQNIEILLSIVLISSAYLYSRKRTKLSFTLISICTTVKFFPIILLPLFTLKIQRLRLRITYAALTLAVFLWILPDLIFLSGKVTPGLSGTYGLRNLFPWLTSKENTGATALYSLVCLMVWILTFVFVMLFFFCRTIKHSSIIKDFHLIIFCFSALIFVSTWFLNSNYAYRMIFLAISLLTLDKVTGDSQLTTLAFIGYLFFASPLSTSLSLQRNLSVSLLSGMLLGILFAIGKKFNLTRSLSFSMFKSH
jgi:hypothetical protein